MVAEIGADARHFPSAAHLSSWAGMCPGNHESAGKRRVARPAEAIAGYAPRWWKPAVPRAIPSAPLLAHVIVACGDT